MSAPLSPHALVYGFTPAGDPQVSPDGRRVAYVLSRTDAETHKSSSEVWLCGIDGANKRRLTFTGERNHSPRWSPDGDSIAFVSDRVAKNGVFIMPMAGGEARELLQAPTPISDLAWSPDGTRLAFCRSVDPANPGGAASANGAAPAVRVTSRIDYKQDNRGYLGDNRSQVFVVDVASGEAVQRTTELVDHASPQWSPDGRTLACRVATQNGMVTRLKLVAAGGGRERYVTWEDGVVSTYAWSPEGNRIVFSGDPDHTSQTDLFVYDVVTSVTRRITDDLQCLPDGGFPTITPPSHPVWVDEHTIVFSAFQRGASATFSADLRAGVTQIEGEQELRSGFSHDAANRYFAATATSLSSNAEVAIIDRSEGRRTLITGYGDAVLAVTPAARWERFDVQRGGYTTEAWLLLPQDFDPAKKYPVVIDVHGGPNGHYGHGFVAMQQCMATNGIALLISNPRGSTSYGRDFTRQVYGDWGGEDYLDLMAVVDRALERPYLDAARTGIYGYSYGGYMTAWTISQTQRFKAAVCGAPCFDLESMFGTSDISHMFGALQWTGAPHEAREWYATHSPSQFAHNTKTPTLIIHGEADDRCPIGQGEQMFVALKKAGCEVEFARYPGGLHLFMRVGPPEHREDALSRVLGWFKAHLGEPV